MRRTDRETPFRYAPLRFPVHSNTMGIIIVVGGEIIVDASQAEIELGQLVYSEISQR